MAAYGVPPALGVSPELHEAVSTGVRQGTGGFWARIPAEAAKGSEFLGCTL